MVARTIVFLICVLFSANAFAQAPDPAKADPATVNDKPQLVDKELQKKEVAKKEVKKTIALAKEAEEEDTEKARESSHGGYEWKMSYGGGFDIGLWFNDLQRFNTYLEPATAIDVSTLWNFDLYLEGSFYEGTRIALFGGLQTPFSSNPDISALYFGIEPAFAFRRDMWEIALGIGVGFGSATVEYDNGDGIDAGVTVLRPFIELRRYLNDWVGVYGRFGFNQWLIHEDPTVNGNLALGVSENNLSSGGAWLSIGARFGYYPQHVKAVGDQDGDKLRDDIDDCPEQAEDFDKFEDEDGCPEDDNDKDGIKDNVDKCPLVAEDMDGWQDEDGCPESDDDADGDGILNAADKCPNEAEDKDGFQDEDGCPDTDNDNDKILDVNDKCPNEAGVPEKAGCPFRRVEITMGAIKINEKIFFELNKAVIKEQSFSLLDEVAGVINTNAQIKLMEIGGHTDLSGSARYNQKLSERRAKSVFEYLATKGVDKTRMKFKGYGKSSPLVPLAEGQKKETAEAAEKNRRVEIKILEQEEVKKTVREDEVPADVKKEDAKPVDPPK